MTLLSPFKLGQSTSEDAQQTALFAWLYFSKKYGFEHASRPESYKDGGAIDLLAKQFQGQDDLVIPELEWCHSIPNGGQRSKSQAAKLKATGVKRGVSDICLPVKRGKYSGLYIELKQADGKEKDVSTEQWMFGEFVQQQGFYFKVCFGWKSAAQLIEDYVNGEEV